MNLHPEGNSCIRFLEHAREALLPALAANPRTMNLLELVDVTRAIVHAYHERNVTQMVVDKMWGDIHTYMKIISTYFPDDIRYGCYDLCLLQLAHTMQRYMVAQPVSIATLHIKYKGM